MAFRFSRDSHAHRQLRLAPAGAALRCGRLWRRVAARLRSIAMLYEWPLRASRPHRAPAGQHAWGPCSGSPCGGGTAAACRPRPARCTHGPERVRRVTFLPARPPPIAGAWRPRRYIYAQGRVTAHKSPSLKFFASRRRFILINSKVKVVGDSCVCESSCLPVGGVGCGRPGHSATSRCPYRDGPKRSNNRGGQGVEQWVRATTEAGRQRFTLPGLVRKFPTPERMPPKAPKFSVLL